MRTPVFGGFGTGSSKLGCTTTEEARGLKLLIKELRIAKTKALISSVITAQLICGFVFCILKQKAGFLTTQLQRSCMMPLND